MAKKNDDFFVEKKAWSIVKDELLGCYFKPYVAKILHTSKPLIYVDCFAGKGKFDNGSDGSPLISLRIINECLASTKMHNAQIEPIFIDLNYADYLKENLKEYPCVKIVSGKYEDKIREVLCGKEGCNVFLYIDPYGIKALQCALFDYFAKGQFNSIELLINMNSFGFIREACHALGTTFDDKCLFDDLVEYAPTKLDASDKSINELNKIAGGEYWKSIIESYKKGRIDGYEAESIFANQYCKRLMESYNYVLNMPLRIRNGQRPKYRLIHATNHRDGCLLMVDNICNRWQALKTIQNGGQMTLWPETVDNQVIEKGDIKERVMKFFSRCDSWISLYDALAKFFMKYGPICHTKEVKDILRNFEDDGRLAVIRNPEKTEKGRCSRFMSEGDGKTVYMRWRQ